MDLHEPIPHPGDSTFGLESPGRGEPNENGLNPAREFQLPADSDPSASASLDPDAMVTVESTNAAAFAARTGPRPVPAHIATGTGTATGTGDNPLLRDNAPPPEEPNPEAAPVETKPAEAADAGPKLRRKRKAVRRRWDAPAWVLSALIHGLILGTLGAFAASSGETLRKILPNFDTALTTTQGPKEETPILADPADVPRTDAVGDPAAPIAGANVGFAQVGADAPSATPAVRRPGRAVNQAMSLPTIPVVGKISGLRLTPANPSRDLGGGGMIGGDVTYTASEVGVALDQIAREILRHLTQHKLTVVWMFDESESMRDDQRAIKAKFDRVVNELRVNTPDDQPSAKAKKKSTVPPLAHAIVGFGDDVHFELEKPTIDIELIGRAIDRLRIDSTGKENTMSAVAKVINHYSGLISSDRKLLIVLVTDESGDDGDFIEEARQAAVSRDVPIYVIGRQALFGYGFLRIAYTDPVTKDVYWVGIRRGPETADVESLQWDGIHPRWDELPSGFGPYELARLAKDSGGIYFLLPTEENQRVIQREKAYSIATLKEYVPDYESRAAYAERRQKSELRRTLSEVISFTKPFPFRHHYPVIPEQLLSTIEEDLPVVENRLQALIDIEKRLRKLGPLRDRELEKRWQAAYDLMLAQVVVYQIKAYEYRANLLEMRAKPPRPSELPSPELSIAWALDHSTERKAPKELTEKKVAEAERLLRQVIDRHPNTPWADLAQDEISRGFFVKRNEWKHRHTGRYEERRKLVPQF